MEITEYHEALNKEGNVPPKCYRRDKKHYELVSYINNIIACYLSSNIKPIEIFTERARLFIEDNPPTNETQKYYTLVLGYLQKVEQSIG